MKIHRLKIAACIGLAIIFSNVAWTQLNAQEQPLTKAQTSEQDVDANEIATKQTKLFLAWSSNEMSSPGLSAEVREVQRNSSSGKLAVKYRIYVTGAPKDQPFSLVTWPINAPSPDAGMEGLSFAADGLLVCAGRETWQCHSDKKDDPAELAFFPAKGEPYRLALISADKKNEVFFAVVPDPIVGTTNGCKVEVVRLLPKFELAVVRAKGFKPNEQLSFESKSYDEVQRGNGKADSGGEYVSSVMPYVVGHDVGKTTFTITTAECSPSVMFEWGK